MFQEDIDRVQEFHKCIECFLCQNVCHVIRDHEENKKAFAGQAFCAIAALQSTRWIPMSAWILSSKKRLGSVQHHKCCTEVCEHIHITDNALSREGKNSG